MSAPARETFETYAFTLGRIAAALESTFAPDLRWDKETGAPLLLIFAEGRPYRLDLSDGYSYA